MGDFARLQAILNRDPAKVSANDVAFLQEIVSRLLDDKIHQVLRWGVSWDGLTTYQQYILKAARHGSSVMRHDESKVREARELESMGLLQVEFDYRHAHAYMLYTTAQGRELLSQVGEE
jgi:hypothetical protein